MALRFTTSDVASRLHGVKTLVYGLAGMGKTRLVATAPTPLLISAESGLLSLREFQIPTIEILTVDDLTDAHKWCQQSKEAAQFETICIDSISEIGEVVLINAKRQVKDPRQAYGELIEKMQGAIRAFRDLSGKHVYMSAKMDLVKDDQTGVTRYMPSMPGSKLGPSLPYMFDEVFRLGLGKTQQGEEFRFLQTRPDLQYDAKDRSGALDAFEPPDLSHIFTKILGATNNGT